MGNDIKQILMRYFTLMALFFAVIILLFSFFFYYLNQTNKLSKKTENIENIMNFLDSAEEQAKMQMDYLYDDFFFRENFSAYLTLPPHEYVKQNLNQGVSSSYIEETFQGMLNNSNMLIAVTTYVDSERLFQLQKKPKNRTWLLTKNISFLLKQQEDKNVTAYLYFDLSSLFLKVTNDSYHYVLRNMDNDVSLGFFDKEAYRYVETIEYNNIRIMVYENKANNFTIISKILITALGLIFLFLIAIWVSLQVVFKSYLQQYHAIMEKLRNNSSKTTDFEIIEITGKKGDLQRIAQEINESIIEREELIKSEYQNLLLKERVELSNLQHQIDPHFLFNNLEFVRMKAFLKNEYEISQFIFEVSQLYRSSLSKSGVITLDEEIIMIQSYLNIYKTRGDGNFKFLIKNEIQSLEIPKFALQPFAENYIKYGLQANQKNYLFIRCVETSTSYIFSFIDNGLGTTEKTIMEIYQKIEEKNHLEKSIGIANSIKRLKLFYKTRVDYEVKNIPQRGFLIRIVVYKNSV
ncbi:sensor histidine kinase [Enterococcus sp. LJL98]